MCARFVLVMAPRVRTVQVLPMVKVAWIRVECVYYLLIHRGIQVRLCNSNSNSTFIALNLRQKTDSKAHHTKTLFNIQKPETLQGSAPRRKQKGDWKFRVGMLFQRGMTSTLT